MEEIVENVEKSESKTFNFSCSVLQDSRFGELQFGEDVT